MDIDHQVGLPTGWRQCPKYAVVPDMNLIASKVGTVPFSIRFFQRQYEKCDGATGAT